VPRSAWRVTMPSTAVAYRSRAVRALVLLHDEHLRRFLVVWNQAQAASIVLPKTDDPAYASLETLLRHVLGAARGYMTWMCEVLELPDPEIRAPAESTTLAADAASYMEHVLEKWRTPLQDVGDDRLETPEYQSRWQSRYCIDSMLEHAVMHPIRHAFQLESLMRQR
jgi:DinB family protein